MLCWIYAPTFKSRFSTRIHSLTDSLEMHDLFSANVQYHETLIVNPATGKSVPAEVWLAAQERVQ